MQEFFAGLKPEIALPLGGMLFIGIIVISVVGMIQWRWFRQAGMEAALKQQMLDRGMSAEEIVRVLSASPSTTSKDKPIALSEMKETAAHKG
ncbi:MAG TPA: hypothetical protein VGY66_29480 [Gemmataceae bacterium]|jgi:hypothetical protein|nr:hypothetical protein [Gemmataceae bacterium]